MKKSLIKLLSSTIAFTLVLAVSGSAGTAQMSKVQAEAQPERAVSVVEEVKEESKGTGIIEVLEEKLEAEVPVVEVAKAEAPAVEEVASPVVELADLAKAAEVEEVAAPEIEVVPAEEVAAPEVAEEAVAEWNISETASDNVTMKFYADAKAEANGQVNVNTVTGEVIISGTGAMEESIYRHFMSVEKYVAAVKTAIEGELGTEVVADYDPAITDVIELDATIRFLDSNGEEVCLSEEARWNLDPADFLAFSPASVTIAEGITNVSDHAFICCANLLKIELPSTIEYIGQQAFQYCTSLESVEMPMDTEIREGAFEYCRSLTSVMFEDYALDNNGLSANAESVNALTQEEINVLIGVAYQ